MLKLNLLHMFTNIIGGNVISYCKDINSEKFYKVINHGTVGHVQEEIQEISELEFRKELTERIHLKRQHSNGMATKYTLDIDKNNEITFGLEDCDPHEMLVKEIRKSFDYSFEDADFYAQHLLKLGMDLYRKGGDKNGK